MSKSEMLRRAVSDLKIRFQNLEQKSTLTPEEWGEAETIKTAFEAVNGANNVPTEVIEGLEIASWISRINDQFRAWREAQQRTATFGG